ncbi:hypothetical protein [Roseovarius aestuarii]|uniref:Lipoprotein n=1 Tax=Roseovarius aestuarii TaxID=475083 RepID=A0A1X7BR22_9RHOB|nr:hypothetical protein [Roseovarius aestuarii]SMC12023.1 hypothetical protein ROA7745_01844 [Roseovarius aestuarii]
MRSFVIAGVVGSLVLAACAPVSGPEADGVGVAFKGEAGKAFVAGLQPVPVSLKKQGEDEKLAADCVLDSSKYTATFKAPATVNVPAYSEGAVAAKLSCTYEDQTYSKNFAPVNLSKRSRNQSATAVGVLLCPICGIGMAAGNSRNKNQRDGDIYGFLKMDIEIEKEN